MEMRMWAKHESQHLEEETQKGDRGLIKSTYGLIVIGVGLPGLRNVKLSLRGFSRSIKYNTRTYSNVDRERY